MGEESINPSSLSPTKDSAMVEEYQSRLLQEHHDQTQDPDSDGVPDSPVHDRISEDRVAIEEKAVISDQVENLARSGEMDEKGASFQEFKDDCVIPSPVLKSGEIESFFGPDLSSALQILATKYNNLVMKCQVQASETETLRMKSESLSSKCLQECEPKFEDLKKKYTYECSERKRLYNELIELRGNIRVFCRCRPLSSDDISKGHTNVIEFDPSQDSELQVICPDNSKKQFKFDHVFGPEANQGKKLDFMTV